MPNLSDDATMKPDLPIQPPPTGRQPYLRAASALLAVLPAALVLTAGGCRGVIEDLPLIYKMDINQGNVVDKDDLAMVREGMTKSQVLSILGSPAIADPFHQDRWDYVYTLAPRGGKMVDHRHLLLTFEGDRLATIEGNYLEILEVAEQAADEVEAEQHKREKEEKKEG